MTKSKRLKRISHIIVLCMLVLEWSSPAVFANDVETTYTEIPAQEITTFPSDLAELVSTPDPITPVESPADTTETTIDTTNTIIPMPVDATGAVETASGELAPGLGSGIDTQILTGADSSIASGETLTGTDSGTGDQIFVVDQNTLNQETIVPLIDHETVVDNFKLIAPTIQKLYDAEGRFDPTTLQSFITAGGVPSITYCSMITRNNIATLLGISPTDTSLAWGDATTLIQNMMNEGRGYTVSRYDIEQTLLAEFAMSKATIFDVYSYNGNLSDGKWENGHRITIVLGTDNLLYVLDPIRAFTHEPVLLSKYIQYFLEYDTVYINKQAYNPYGLINQGLEQSIDISNTGIVVTIPSGTVIDPVGQTGLSMDSIVQDFVVIQNEFLYNNGDAFVVKNNTPPTQTVQPEIVSEVQTGTVTGDVIGDGSLTGALVEELTGQVIVDSTGVVDVIEVPSMPSDVPLVIIDLPEEPVLTPEEPVLTPIESTVTPIQGLETVVVENMPEISEPVPTVNETSSQIIESTPTLVDALVDTTILVPINEIMPENYTLQIELPFQDLLGTGTIEEFSQSDDNLVAPVDDQLSDVVENVIDPINPENPIEIHSDETRFPTLFDDPGVDVNDINNVVDIDTMSEYEQVIMDTEVAPAEPIIIGAYKIGNIDSHLVFSKPVKVEIAVHQPEGEEVAILVKHEGFTEYSVQGLAVDEAVTCSGGIASTENNITYVQDGKVTFYTCGASDFLATVSAGNATIVYPVSGSTIYETQPMFLGTGTNTGATITVSFSGGAVIGTATVAGGNWGVYANTALPEGDHTICISGGGGCSSFTISTFIETKGDIDNSFTGTFANTTVQTTNLFSDNSVLAGGLFATFNGITRRDLVATTTTGAIKTTFTGLFSNNTVITTYVLPNDYVLVGGTFTTFNGITRTRLARITNTGALDTSFTGTFANSDVKSIAVQPDGKVLVAGGFTTMNGITRNRLARLTTTGALDTTFTGTFANNIISTVTLQPDGKVLVGGTFTTMNGVTRNRLARLTITGALDTTFTGTFTTTGVNVIRVRPDGDILLGGAFTTMNGVTRNRLARLTITGALDISFTGTFANNSVLSMSMQSDGSLILGGTFTTFNGISKNRLVRLQPTVPTATITTPMSGSSIVERKPLIQGTGNVEGAEISVSYSGGGLIGTAVVDGGVRGFFPSANVDTGQQILCASTIYMTGTSCVSVLVNDFIESNGTIDYTFSGTFANNIVYSVETALDGEFIVGGLFTGFNGSLRNRLARMTTTGSLDTTFTGTFNNNGVLATINQSDGDVVVAGLFTGFNGVTRNRLARVTLTGALDTTFTGTFANNIIHALLALPDGKILVGGAFTGFDGIVRNRLARITTTGGLDTTFTGTFANSGVFAMAMQPDGKVLVAGGFTTMNGITRNRLARLTNTGALDTTFTGTFANNTVDSIAIQSDGKILVGGTFTGFNGIARNRLARLTTTGALDTTFTGVFANSEINAILLQPDGKVLIGGSFTTMNSVSRNYIARLTTTGVLDTAFTGTFANSGVNHMAFASNGDIIVGGSFTTFNGISRNRIVRLTTFIPGIVSVSAPVGLSFNNSGISSFVAQTLQEIFTGMTNYFSVDDAKSSDSGYNTTIQLSGHLTDGLNVISGSNVLFREVGGIDVIAGLTNPRVELDAATSGFQSLNSPRSFIRRNTAANFNTVGEYGANIEMRVDVPAAQPPGNYTGTIIYTLIEN